jgi:predicted DNA binding CopG/RHH family protein
MNNTKIPQTDSIHELAEFWDTHNLTDFEDELEEVKEPVFVRKIVMKIELESKEAMAVKEIAQSKGILYTDLLRQWIVERIHHIA